MSPSPQGPAAGPEGLPGAGSPRAAPSRSGRALSPEIDLPPPPPRPLCPTPGPPLPLPDVLPPKGEGLRLAIALLHPAGRQARHGTARHRRTPSVRAAGGFPASYPGAGPGQTPPPRLPPSRLPRRDGTGRDVPSRPLPVPLGFPFGGTRVSCRAEADQPRVSPVPWSLVGFLFFPRAADQHRFGKQSTWCVGAGAQLPRAILPFLPVVGHPGGHSATVTNIWEGGVRNTKRII